MLQKIVTKQKQNIHTQIDISRKYKNNNSNKILGRKKIEEIEQNETNTKLNRGKKEKVTFDE